MDDIKPVGEVEAIEEATDEQGVSAWVGLDFPVSLGDKLYPESALLQAKEEGRREGMRDALAALNKEQS